MKLEKLILGTFAAFWPAWHSTDNPDTSGVFETRASSLFYPTDQVDAWDSLGDVLDSSLDSKTDDYSDTVPDASGGYRTQGDVVVLQDNLKLSLLAHSETIHKLVWGIAADDFDDGVAVTPFANKRRFIEGWINFTLRGQDGADRVVAALWGRMRIDGAPKWAKDPTKPAVIFEILPSPVASLVLDHVKM